MNGPPVLDRLAGAIRRVDEAYFCVDDHGNRFPQTSNPEMIAAMLRALEVNAGCHVLEIGTGSGYTTALLAELVGAAGVVASIDVDPPVSERARSLLSSKGYMNAYLRTGDGRRGWPFFAPYDRVVAWCSVTVVPRTWIDQSGPEALLLVPIRTGRRQSIYKYRRSLDGGLAVEERFAGAFIPATATPFHPWEHHDDR
jgi:protein-L-isoaspartate(D-aspartate) O-methyltransferase